MRGIKGTCKSHGDFCCKCKNVLTKKNSVLRSPPRKGLASYCRGCINKIGNERRKKNPQAHKNRCKAYRLGLRMLVLSTYGGKCACCGERNHEFLALDHINGGGTKERKSYCNNTSSSMYRRVRDAGFPKDKYRLLCHNCNCAMGWYGKCPHTAP